MQTQAQVQDAISLYRNHLACVFGSLPYHSTTCDSCIKSRGCEIRWVIEREAKNADGNGNGKERR